MFDLLEQYPDAENMLEILKKDYLGVDSSEEEQYSDSIENDEG